MIHQLLYRATLDGPGIPIRMTANYNATSWKIDRGLLSTIPSFTIRALPIIRFGSIGEEGCVSRFGNLIRELRKEQGLTIELVARKIGTSKGYVSGIENGKVNPPSMKFVLKLAKLLGQEPRLLVRLSWVDKAPAILRDEAEEFLKWCQARDSGSPEPDRAGAQTSHEHEAGRSPVPSP